MASVFRNVIEFFGALGVYDVLLPFLLTYVILFAILEKSKVLGTEKYKGQDVSRKSLNAIASFVVGFLVVGSGQLVSIINEAVAKVMVLVIIGALFMALIGVFHAPGGFMNIPEKWKTGLIIASALGIALIFMDAITLKSGVSVLDYIYDYTIKNASGTVIGTIVLLIILVGGMYFIVKDPKESSNDS